MPLALVTGGGIRIGRAISLALGKSGFDLLIHYNSSQAGALQTVADLASLGRKATAIAADLSTPEGVRSLADAVATHTKRLDCLVLSAASYEHTDFADITLESLERMWAVNVRAPFLLTQHLLPLLRAGGEPSCIVAITDATLFHGYTASHHFSHYAATKGALAQLVRSWATELAPGIRVNAVAPGPVAFGDDTTEAQRNEILAKLPLRREGTPMDIGAAVEFLVRSPYITGHALIVDGGQSVL